jgi:hypothetical protein
MLDFRSHQAREKADVEAADLRVVFRQVVVDAVLAFHARQFAGFGGT